MATIVSTFISHDGKKFKSLEEANAHEAKLALDADLSEYVKSLNFRSASPAGLTLSQNRVKKTIAGYLLWKQGVRVDPAEQADEATAA